ncbi:hypothetical protein FZL45_10080 [Campylobacter jejuni]|nr:hypothetical protein [Campylobacter jejuni]
MQNKMMTQHFELTKDLSNLVLKETKKYNMTKAEFYRMVVDDYFKKNSCEFNSRIYRYVEAIN